MEIPHHFSIFYSLARSIVYQQLAGAAAAAIMARVEALFPKGRMTPKNLLEMDDASCAAPGCRRTNSRPCAILPPSAWTAPCPTSAPSPA